MAQVNVINVIAHNAKAPFESPISFEIFFEALQPLSKSKFFLISNFLMLNHTYEWLLTSI